MFARACFTSCWGKHPPFRICPLLCVFCHFFLRVFRDFLLLDNYKLKSLHCPGAWAWIGFVCAPKGCVLETLSSTGSGKWLGHGVLPSEGISTVFMGPQLWSKAIPHTYPLWMGLLPSPSFCCVLAWPRRPSAFSRGQEVGLPNLGLWTSKSME